jgi:hypothetical protein
MSKLLNNIAPTGSDFGLAPLAPLFLVQVCCHCPIISVMTAMNALLLMLQVLLLLSSLCLLSLLLPLLVLPLLLLLLPSLWLLLPSAVLVANNIISNCCYCCVFNSN